MMTNNDKLSWILRLADRNLVGDHLANICAKTYDDISLQGSLKSILNHLRVLLLDEVDHSIVELSTASFVVALSARLVILLNFRFHDKKVSHVAHVAFFANFFMRVAVQFE